MIDVAAAVQVHLGLSAVFAIDSKIVVAGGIELAANDALTTDSGCTRDDFQQRRPIASLRRHFCHLSGLNRSRTNAVFSLNQRSFRGDVDGRAGRTFDLKDNHAQCKVLKRVQGQVCELFLPESRQLDGQ